MISNDINSQNGVTDFPLSLNQIADNVDTLRVRVIEDLDSKGFFKQPFFNYTQTIDFTSTQKDSTQNNQRYVDIPRILFLSDGSPAITYIGAANGFQTYRKVWGLQREVHTKDRWIGSKPTAIITENGLGYRIFFKNISPISLKLIAVFQNPSDLESYGYNGWKTTAEGGSVYPMTSGQVDIVMGKIVDSYMRYMYRIRPQGDQAVDAPQQSKEQS